MIMSSLLRFSPCAALLLIALQAAAIQPAADTVPSMAGQAACITRASVFAYSIAPATTPGAAEITVRTVLSFADDGCSSGNLRVAYALNGQTLGESQDSNNAFPITFEVPDGFTYRFQIIVTDLGTSEVFRTVTSPIRIDVGPPVLEVQPAGTVDFGNVRIGDSRDITFTVSNAAGGALAGTATVFSPYQIVGDSAFFADSNSSQQVTVRFAPPFISSFPSQIFFNAGDGGFVQVNLRGNGVPVTLTLQVDARDQQSGEAIIHAVVRVARVDGTPRPDSELDWQVRSRTADTAYTFALPEPGEYKIVVNANGYDTLSAIETLGAGTTQKPYTLPFTGAKTDTDGDGLQDSDETGIFLTLANERDSDGDGMSDLFEIEYDFNPNVDPNDPLDPTDPDGNPDQDNFTNLQESILRTNPRDERSPEENRFYVSPAGDDGSGTGTRANPWKTINNALTIIYGLGADKEEAPVTLVLLPGTYTENVQLVENLTLVGDQPNKAIIVGRLQGAPGAAIENLRIAEPDTKQAGALLTAADINMRVERVTFGGITGSVAAGIAFGGTASASSVVANCTFNALKTGIDVYGSLPRIRLSTFQNMEEDGILIEDSDVPLGDNTLGDAADPNSGWNVFRENGNLAVNNLRADEITMENNDWGTEDPNEVRDLIAGPADFEPFVPPGLAPASLTCTVEDVGTRDRITAATVSLTPANVPPQTDNVDGIYSFAAIVPDVYNVNVSATGFIPVNLLNQDLTGGGTATLLFSLQREGEDDGGKDSGSGCGPAPRTGTGSGMSDLLVVAAAVIVLAAAQWRVRRSA